MAASVADREEMERAVMITVAAEARARARAMPWGGLVSGINRVKVVKEGGIYLSDPTTCACYEDDYAGLGEFRTFRVNGGIDVAVDGAGESVVDGEAMRRGEI